MDASVGLQVQEPAGASAGAGGAEQANKGVAEPLVEVVNPEAVVLEAVLVPTGSGQ